MTVTNAPVISNEWDKLEWPDPRKIKIGEYIQTQVKKTLHISHISMYKAIPSLIFLYLFCIIWKF